MQGWGCAFAWVCAALPELTWCSGEPWALCSDPEAGWPLLSQYTGLLRSVAKPSYLLCVHIKSEQTHPGYLPRDIMEKDSGKNAISILPGWWLGKHELPSTCFPETIQGLGNYPQGEDVAWAQLCCGSAPGLGRLVWAGPRKGPHCPGRSFVKLLLGFILGCLQDVPGHLLEVSSAQEPCPNGSWVQTAHSQPECLGWLYTPEHLHVLSCCTSGHTSHSSRRYCSGKLLGTPPNHLRYLGLKSLLALFGCILAQYFDVMDKMHY